MWERERRGIRAGNRIGEEGKREKETRGLNLPFDSQWKNQYSNILLELDPQVNEF